MDAHLRRQREKTGNRLVYREKALHACVGALRRGEIVGSVIDMAILPKEGGVYTDFFSVPALTSAALPLLALRRGAPLIFAVCRSLDNGQRYRIDAEEIEIRLRISRHCTQQKTTNTHIRRLGSKMAFLGNS